ncbi:unnamed protein product [Clonostachys rosea f. rosea IK726]|uniref:Uncharacterized protein n=1 Tax=Clonostachys rosea f. rosea IK726 TaxID=1349383 RepID=A0ACA9UHA3_BIOOC|nr:unnamed protein product [Clonostachys rosea f. rosea IK726]
MQAHDVCSQGIEGALHGEASGPTRIRVIGRWFLGRWRIADIAWTPSSEYDEASSPERSTGTSSEAGISANLDRWST